MGVLFHWPSYASVELSEDGSPDLYANFTVDHTAGAPQRRQGGVSIDLEGVQAPRLLPCSKRWHVGHARLHAPPPPIAGGGHGREPRPRLGPHTHRCRPVASPNSRGSIKNPRRCPTKALAGSQLTSLHGQLLLPTVTADLVVHMVHLSVGRSGQCNKTTAGKSYDAHRIAQRWSERRAERIKERVRGSA